MTDSHLAPSRKWPQRPNLEQFKQQAKDLLKAYRAGEADAVAEVERYEQSPDPSDFALNDAQRVLARSYGYASWPKLKDYIEVAEEYARTPHVDPPAPAQPDDPAQRENTFLRLACLTYGYQDHPSRRERAWQMLAEHPDLATASIYTVAAIGDVAATKEMLNNNPELVRTPGGPYDIVPLLYASYSRLNSEAPGHSTLEVARLMLEHGADPNAGWLQYNAPYTALTGALGDVESCRPRRLEMDHRGRVDRDPSWGGATRPTRRGTAWPP